MVACGGMFKSGRGRILGVSPRSWGFKTSYMLRS